MKSIEFIAAVVVGGLLLAGAGCGKTGDSDNIDGKWVGADTSNPAAQYQITIGDGRFEFRGANEAESFKGDIAVFYTESQPGSLDVTVTEPAQLAGKAALFIFERQGNEMKLAWEAPGTFRRPSGFDPQPGVRIATFKRE